MPSVLQSFHILNQTYLSTK